MDAKKLRAELRKAIADYIASEGCGCCVNDSKHEEAEARIASLLNVPKYDDQSGFDFSRYESKR